MNSHKSWYVYMLLCDQKTYYIGITNNLKNRLNSHRAEENSATKEFSDLKLVYCEKYNDKYQAAKRERQLKGWSHAKKQLRVRGELGINTCTAFVEV